MPAPPSTSSIDASEGEDAVQRHALQRRVTVLCILLATAIGCIDLLVWYRGHDIWKLSIAACLGTMAASCGVSLLLQRQRRHLAALWFLLVPLPISLTWLMVTGGAATSVPTLSTSVAMMLLLPDTLRPGVISARLWLGLLLGAYLSGIALRYAIRGLDFANTTADLAILIITPIILIFTQWILTQRIFRNMRATLAESESLRRDHQLRNQQLVASQRALERASAAKSQFLANMSHELRTPLNIILGYTELLKDDLADRPASERAWDQDLTTIHGAGQHLLSLISDILDLSKIEAGKLDTSIEPVSLTQLVHEVTDACQPLVSRMNNRLLLELDPHVDTLHTDRLKLRQILLNLLSNAAKFTADGRITLRTRACPHDRVHIDVEDTGTGIPEDAQTRIFDAFEQADTSPTRSHGGTGLGLTLVRRFARLLGGDVTLDSRLGHGSRFRVDLPRRAPASGPADP